MANIKVTVDYTILNGQPLTFKSPADCSQVTGLVVSYPEGGETKSKTFQFADAHGNNVGDIDLFASNVLVKVILDVDAKKAYVQNADTNAYLEAKFDTKAPAGYGLGTFATIGADDWDTFTGGGFYCGINNAPTNSWWWGLNIKQSTSTKLEVQKAWQYINSRLYSCERVKNNDGVWQPWEWVNPPMELGVEYRTTERYLGKPVYAKVIDFGAMPNNTQKQVSFGITNLQYIAHCFANMKGGDIIPNNNTESSPTRSVKLNYVSNYNGGFARIQTDYNFSTINAYITLKYTKTTD